MTLVLEAKSLMLIPLVSYHLEGQNSSAISSLWQGSGESLNVTEVPSGSIHHESQIDFLRWSIRTIRGDGVSVFDSAKRVILLENLRVLSESALRVTVTGMPVDLLTFLEWSLRNQRPRLAV